MACLELAWIWSQSREAAGHSFVLIHAHIHFKQFTAPINLRILAKYRKS